MGGDGTGQPSLSLCSIGMSKRDAATFDRRKERGTWSRGVIRASFAFEERNKSFFFVALLTAQRGSTHPGRKFLLILSPLL